MYYIEKIDNKISRYTEDEKLAKKFYANYIKSKTEPVRGFDGTLYINNEEIPQEVKNQEITFNIQKQIQELEFKITLRRMREAMLGNNESVAFIEDIEKHIEELRGTV